MKYILMHRDITVAELELDDATCTISSIGNVYNASHLPVGVPVRHNEIDRAALNEWWSGRAIPASRDGIRDMLEQLQIMTTQRLLDKCLGLSLSDQYWICPQASPCEWKDVNFFENDFSEDVGNALFGVELPEGGNIDLMSPDNTSDGWLKKKWTIVDGQRCLLKGGSGAAQQEPYNEVLASAICRRLGIEHVPYEITVRDGEPYSVCRDFITPDTELVTAWYVMQTQKKQNHVSVYQHYVQCCDALGIPNVTRALDQMIVLDYLVANEDRHQNNFGVVRDARTLEWIGSAPIYDSGTSMWFDKFTPGINPEGKIKCKPFKTDHEEQIKLVRSFDWIDISALQGLDEEYKDILKDAPFIDQARCNALCHALERRIDKLEQHIRSHENTAECASDKVHGDVSIDIAYSGAAIDQDDEMEL